MGENNVNVGAVAVDVDEIAPYSMHVSLVLDLFPTTNRISWLLGIEYCHH
jgi:hypothetical protein